MKYPVFFMLLAAYFSFLTASLESNLRFILLWPIASAILFAVAYAANQPQLIAGKNRAGRNRRLGSGGYC